MLGGIDTCFQGYCTAFWSVSRIQIVTIDSSPFRIFGKQSSALALLAIKNLSNEHYPCPGGTKMLYGVLLHYGMESLRKQSTYSGLSRLVSAIYTKRILAVNRVLPCTLLCFKSA